MKITCLDRQVGQLLGEAFYKIPRFQRSYSWDRTNVEEFWTDAVVDHESDYFIGNFVVYDDKGVLGVVDGQQRLTTITLLLCSIRDAFAKEGLAKLAKGVHSLIERRDIKDERYYVLQTETSYPYFQEHIQKFGDAADVYPEAGPEEQLLKQAFDFLNENITATVKAILSQPSLSETKKKTRIEEELSKIRDKVLGLKLIFTSLDNEDDAYVIFETLNTRGKDLTLSDLVKSHLSRILKPRNKGVDLAKDKWGAINATFEASAADLSVSTFVHHFWLSRHDYVTEKKLYKALRKQIKKDNAAAFLNDLLKESRLYRQIHEPSFRKWKKEELQIRDSLNALNLFRIKQQLPMVLAVMRHYDDATLKTKHVTNVLRDLENFHFAFTAVTSQRSSGGISFMYAKAARDLYSATDLPTKVKRLGELHKKLVDRRPSSLEFEASFIELRYSSKFTKQRSLVRYILTRLYEHNSPGLALDPDKMTIEHLAPESPTNVSDLTDENVASIGNLILVDQALNEKLANKSVAEKRDILKAAGVWVDSTVMKASGWGAKQIEQRAKLLAKDAYNNVWKL